MTIPITEEFRNVCREIVSRNLTIQEWCEIESDDMFQTEHFEGGFEAIEEEFTFSYISENEYWFQLTLEEVSKIAVGENILLEGRIAER